MHRCTCVRTSIKRTAASALVSRTGGAFCLSLFHSLTAAWWWSCDISTPCVKAKKHPENDPGNDPKNDPENGPENDPHNDSENDSENEIVTFDTRTRGLRAKLLETRHTANKKASEPDNSN